jgi:tetratricopeptide (TPR) repeat protein
LSSKGSRARAAASSDPAPSSFLRPAVAIFAVALAVRLVHVWQIRRAPFFSVLMGDSHGYDEWARQIAAGDWFGHDVFYQAPLYPYFLGVVYAVAGRSLLTVRILQAVIGSASCVLLALAARRLFSTRVGLAAGVMLALYAPAIFFDGLIQKTVLDVFLVCLSLWIIAGIAEGSTSPWPWLSLGLAMGGLSLTRENAMVFVLVIVCWALIRREPLAMAGAFLVGLALVLVPVAARNSTLGGGFYVTTSQFGPNLYIGNNPAADGTYQPLGFGRGAPEFERRDATEMAEHALGRTLTPSGVSRYWTDRALSYITSRPAEWLELTGRKVALLWNTSEMLDTESQETYGEWSLPLRLLGPIGRFGILVPLALFGIVVTWPRRSRFMVIHAMLLAYCASVVLFYVFARYRFPLVPFLMLFAAAGVLAVPDAIRARAVPGGVWTLAALGAVALFTNRPMLSGDVMQAVTESNLGAALQSEGRFEEAIAHYQRAIALRPDYAPVYTNMASALHLEGRLTEAIATYERLLKTQPNLPDAQYNLANALMDDGRTDEAITHFQAALQSIPASVDVHTNLGLALAGKGQVDAAIEELRAALQIDPRAAKPHRNLGDLLAAAGRQEEAVEHLRQAAQLEPTDASARYDLASVLLEARRFDEAVAEFRTALALTPGSAEAHNNLGIALGSLGRLDEAIGEFQQALRIQPGFEDARRNLAVALAQKKKD